MNGKQFTGWVFAGFGLVVIVVGSYFNHTVSAMTADLGFGFGTVIRKHQITRTDNHSYDYRVEVALSANESNAVSGRELSTGQVLADVTEVDFNSLEEGSKIALAWQRSNPSNNFAGAEVSPLVNGVISQAEFAELQTRKGIFALYAGTGVLLLGVLILSFTRAQAKEPG